MQGCLRVLLAASLALFSFACSAQNTDTRFKEGEHYQKVREAQKPVEPARITVEEFFWYGCQHCYALEPLITAWAAKKPADVDFLQVPASLGRPQGTIHQKTFYTAEALNLKDKVHKPLFDAIHQRQLPLNSPESIRSFFNSQSGVLPDLFDSSFNGFAVDSRVRRAEALARGYGVVSVPTVIVGGKYLTNASMNDTYPAMLEAVDFLIKKVREER